MSNLLVQPLRLAVTAAGVRLPGAKLWFTLTTTSTPAPVYTTNALSTPHANPVIADSNGQFAPIFLDPAVTYRMRLYTAAGTVGVSTAVEDYDPVSTSELSASDRGDVVTAVGGGMTVEAASPAGGTFQVNGVTKWVGTSTGLGAASSFAAMYRHATNGITLYGDGTTYDLTLANKSNAAVMRVLTGTTTAAFVGAVTVAGTLAVTGAATFVAGALLASPTAGLGYATGAGGTVTQATSKSTGVTLSKVTGQITMNAASLAAATTVSFTLTNTTIAATDTVIVNIASGGTVGAYTVTVSAVAAGSCQISLRNETAGALGEAVVLTFAVIKAVIA